MSDDTPIFDEIEKPTPIYGSITDPVPTQKENPHGVNAPSKVPQPKVVAATAGAGVGGAVSTIVIWIVEASAQIDIPEAVELSSAVVISAALAFVAGYFKRN